jgi:hypothetical protein
MSDTQAAMREFRFLDDKRKTNGLTAPEEQRWYELAAQLGVDMSQYGQWGADGQWYPYPVGYDPNQAGYYDPDQAAAQGWYGQQQGYGQQAYAQNQPAYDPNQQAYDPNQQAYDPNQQAYDPNQQAYDPNQQAYDPNQQTYDPNQPAYDAAQYPAQPPSYGYPPAGYPAGPQYPPPGYPPQQGWYGQPGYADPAQAYPQYPPQPVWDPVQGAYVTAAQPALPQQPWQQPAAWPTGPAAPAPLTVARPPAADAVMEISDDEVSPLPTAPPVAARASVPAPPLNLSVPDDPMGDLRDSLLEDVPESGAATAAKAPLATRPEAAPPVNLPPRPLFGGAGFSVPKPPPSTFPTAPKPEPVAPRLEATAVSALLPEPADEVPLIDVRSSGGISAESATQLEVAAASALEGDGGIEEASISQVTSIEEVDLALTSPAPSRPSPVTSMEAAAPPVAVLPDLAGVESVPEVSAVLEVAPSSPQPVLPELNVASADESIPEVSAVLEVAPYSPQPVLPELNVAPADGSIPEVSAVLEVAPYSPQPVLPELNVAPADESIPEVSAVLEVAPYSPQPVLPELSVAAADESIPEVSTVLQVAPYSPQPVLPDLNVAPADESIPQVSAVLDVAPYSSQPVLPELDVVPADEPIEVAPHAPEPVPPAEEPLPEVSAVLEVAPSSPPLVTEAAPAVNQPLMPDLIAERWSDTSLPFAASTAATLPEEATPSLPSLMHLAAADAVLPEVSAVVEVAPPLVEAPAAFPQELAGAPAEDPSFDVSRAADPEVPAPDSSWADVVEASRGPAAADAGFAPSLDDLPVVDSQAEPNVTVSGFEASLDDLPVVGGEIASEAPAAIPRPSAPSAFDALAIPPPGDVGAPSVMVSEWDAPEPKVAATEVLASNWDDAPAPLAPATEVFASSWEEALAPVAPATEVFASNWGAPPTPATEVFASNWEEPPAPAAPSTDRSALFGGGADFSASPDDRIELASNADFIAPTVSQSELPTLDVGDVSVDTESFEVESGPAASLATRMIGVSGEGVEDAPIELSNNADFLDAQALTSTGESWQRTGATLDLAPEENDGEIIQGVVVEEEPASDPGWDSAILAPAPAPRLPETRVAMPMAPAPVMAAPPPQVPAPPPVAPAPPQVPAAPARVMADELFDRSGTVKSQGPVVLPGDHRVILHTIEGQVKRGALKDPDLGADALSLEAQGGAVESIALGRVKAIFFMLAPGARSPAGEGQKIRVTFKDGRQVAGFSRDHGKGGPGFFVVPADNRTNTERIFIYRHGVEAVGIET